MRFEIDNVTCSFKPMSSVPFDMHDVYRKCFRKTCLTIKIINRFGRNGLLPSVSWYNSLPRGLLPIVSWYVFKNMFIYVVKTSQVRDIQTIESIALPGNFLVTFSNNFVVFISSGNIFFLKKYWIVNLYILSQPTQLCPTHPYSVHIYWY